MLPKIEKSEDGVAFVALDPEDPLPDPGQVSKVEHVVELGRGRQHLFLCLLPNYPGQRNQQLHKLDYFFVKPSTTNVTFTEDTCITNKGNGK
jgi:hypothetical protein